MEDNKSGENSEWIRPDEVMKLHQAKRRKKLALQARMNKTLPSDSKLSANIFMGQLGSPQVSGSSQKRKNPFMKDESNKKTKETDKINPGSDASTDSVFFELLKRKSPKKEPENIGLSFKSILQNPNIVDVIEKVETIKGFPYVPLDWTLKTKMRLMSTKPFCWNGKLKTSEQASGTTGFVRCLNIGEQDTTLDTSPNAR